MGWFDNDGADRAKAKREREAEEQLRKYKSGKGKGGGLLSFGNRDEEARSPGLFGLGKRAADDAAQENARGGFFGQTGARHVSNKAREAQRRGQAKSRGNSWWD